MTARLALRHGQLPGRRRPAPTTPPPSGVTYIGPVDTFTSGFNAAWTGLGNTTVVAGRARQEITAAYTNLSTAYNLTFDEGTLLCEVPQIDQPNGTRDVFMYVGKTAANSAQIEVYGPDLFFGSGTSFTSVPYDATAHRWWKIVEAGSGLTFATSPDGSTWTTRRTVAAHGMDLTAVRVTLSCGNSVAVVGGPFYAHWDNVNNPPVSSGGGTFTVADTALSTSTVTDVYTAAPPPGGGTQATFSNGTLVTFSDGTAANWSP